MERKLEKAVEEYLNRQSRKTHPEGQFDNKKRWYPAEHEKQECCSYIRSPSAGWPFSLLVHCRTAEHVANLFKVDVTDLRREARKIKMKEIVKKKI